MQGLGTPRYTRFAKFSKHPGKLTISKFQSLLRARFEAFHFLSGREFTVPKAFSTLFVTPASIHFAQAITPTLTLRAEMQCF